MLALLHRLLAFVLPLSAHAAGFTWNSQWDKFRNPVAGTGIANIGDQFLILLACGWYSFVSVFIGPLAIIAVLWGATTIQYHAVEEGKKEEGKKIIITALIGLVWALVAAAMLQFSYDWVATSVPQLNLPATNLNTLCSPPEGPSGGVEGGSSEGGNQP
jgi:hypothetical protein